MPEKYNVANTIKHPRAIFFLAKRDNALAKCPLRRFNSASATAVSCSMSYSPVYLYLILGSMKAYAKSANKLANTKADAPINVIAIITG